MDSSVLSKYSAQISKANECFTFGRNLFSTWNTTRITFLSMIMDKTDFYLYLVENQFIVTDFVKCKKCDGPMNFRLNRSKADGCVFACNNKIGTGIQSTKCNSTKTVRTNSWFYKSKLSLQEIVLLSYLWWSKLPQIHARKEFNFSSRTVVDWSNFCREVAIDVVFKNCEKIGGPGIVVEIDESKFGKSKFNFLLYFFKVLIIML